MKRRLLASYLSVTCFVLLALGLPLGVAFANTEHRRLERDAYQDALRVSQRAAAVLADGATAARDELAGVVARVVGERGARVAVLDERGEVLTVSPSAPQQFSTYAARVAGRGLEGAGRSVAPTVDGAVAVAVPIVADGSVVGSVLVEVPPSATAARIRANWLLLGALAGAILLVVLLVSTLLARSFARPLADLDRGAARLGDGDLSARVVVPADPPELARLARSFNATAERLEALVRSQKAFVADASHQLRTPLAALRLRLENLQADGPDSRPEDVERALAEVQRLSRLVDSLLVLTRAEADRRAPQAVDLGAVVADRVDAWSAYAAERDVRIDADAPAIQVRSVPGRLEQVLDNLLSNALDVAPARSAVRVVARREDGVACVEVCDAGPGMTPEQRARAFDRFWRGNGARRDGGGFGLGLAIVRELVAADGGAVALGAAPEGGLAVRVRLPLATGAPEDRAARAPVGTATPG